MDWYSIVTLILSGIAAIGTIIVILQAFPINPKISFSGIRANLRKDNPREIYVLAGAQKRSKRDALFDITAELKITAKINDKKETRRASLKNPQTYQKITKETRWDNYKFDFLINLQEWSKPRIQFSYSYFRRGRIVKRKTRWLKATKIQNK